MAFADYAPLVDAARGGDPRALERLVAAAQPDARRYAWRHCHASDVDDAVQESLQRVWRHAGALRAVAAFAGWLLTIVARECRRLARAATRHAPLDEDLLEDRLAARGDAALRVDLVRALESLPAHYLEVVLLRDFEECSIAEIAQRLAEPEGAVKSRLHRARAMVREYLAGEVARGA